MNIAIVAGEQSGDALGASLIAAIKVKYPHAQFIGLAGPKMKAQGCISLGDMETIAVMGVADVIPKLIPILLLRRKIVQYFKRNPPDVFIGIDAPDFNLPIEHTLKARGVKTVHYVSPTLWAWRQGRIHRIKQSVDLMLCLFPFEVDIYTQHGIPVEYLGHPAADHLPTLHTGFQRSILGFAPTDKVIALLPGSRQMEITYQGLLFLQTAQWLHERDPSIKCVLPCAKSSFKPYFEQLMKANGFTFSLTLLEGRSYDALLSADAVLVTSGTATLETFLLDKPMVVVYRMSAFNWWLAQKLVKVSHCAIPNLLAKKSLVPELLQDAATPQACGEAILQWLADPARVEALKKEYHHLREILQHNGSDKAAQAILSLIN